MGQRTPETTDMHGIKGAASAIHKKKLKKSLNYWDDDYSSEEEEQNEEQKRQSMRREMVASAKLHLTWIMLEQYRSDTFHACEDSPCDGDVYEKWSSDAREAYEADLLFRAGDWTKDGASPQSVETYNEIIDTVKELVGESFETLQNLPTREAAKVRIEHVAIRYAALVGAIVFPNISTYAISYDHTTDRLNETLYAMTEYLDQKY